MGLGERVDGFRNRVFVRSTETSLLHVRYVFSQGRNLGWCRRQAGCWVWLVGWVSVWVGLLTFLPSTGALLGGSLGGECLGGRGA